MNPQQLLPWGSLPAALLPRRWAEFLADHAADVVRHRAPRTAARVARNQRLVAGRSSPESVRDAFRSYARYYLGIMRLAHRAPRAAFGPVRWYGAERLDRSLGRGRGVLVLSAHLGHWDLLGVELARRYGGLCAFVEPLAPRTVFAFYTRVRRRHGVMVSLVGTPGRLPHLVLQRNGVLGLVADRPFGTRCQPVPCGGATLQVPTGAIRLALRRGAAIHPAFAVRDAAGFRIDVGADCTEGARARGGPAAVTAVVQAYAAALQAAVVLHGGQWCLLHPMDAPGVAAVMRGAA